MLPRRPQRVPYCKKHCTAHEKWRLANPPTPLDRPQVLPLDVLEQAHVHLLRDVPEAGNFVRPRPTREDLAGRTVPQRLFRREQTLALDVRTLDLAVVDGWVDGPADVHFDICSEWRPVSGQRVDHDFGGRDALCEVEEHLAGVF